MGAFRGIKSLYVLDHAFLLITYFHFEVFPAIIWQEFIWREHTMDNTLVNQRLNIISH